MKIRYFNEFKGLDSILYRIEILTHNNVVESEIKSSASPLKLVYQPVKKLEPVRGSQATINLLSMSNFQFADLHTDDMQGYQIKFYRAKKLYWVGWLDSELYNEQLSAVPPYPVEFSAADFNILERLKYRDENEKRYSDIVPFITHLKRCFDRLGLPFEKLYIGCTTIPNDVQMSSAETPLHVLYMMSDNFYDEENEPMTCREVVESILQPFSLMMVQKDANIFIYDYNTVKQGLSMKRYNFADFSYETDEVINFSLGNLVEIGFASAEGDYGFEEMYNNVTITSSLYGDAKLVEEKIQETELKEMTSNIETDNLIKKVFKKHENWNASEYLFFKSKENNSTLTGAKLLYTGNGTERNGLVFQNTGMFLISQRNDIYLRLKCNAYVNTKNNPLDSNEKADAPETAMRMVIYNRLLLTLGDKKLMYYNGVKWLDIPENEDEKWQKYNYFVFMNSGKWYESRVLNMWLTNSDVYWPGMVQPNTIIDKEKNFQAGIKVPLPPKSGYLKLIIDYAIIDDNSDVRKVFRDVKDLLINSVSITFEDADEKSISTDDFVFKSYVNKKVKADFEDITLKCISANESFDPVGKANILRKEGDVYKFQTVFTRSGLTDILERLLMCTIHSNFTTKNEKITVNIKMTGNPALSHVSCSPILSDSYLITGCTLDFYNAKATISAVSYSEDVARLSNIPYD